MLTCSQSYRIDVRVGMRLLLPFYERGCVSNYELLG